MKPAVLIYTQASTSPLETLDATLRAVVDEALESSNFNDYLACLTLFTRVADREDRLVVPHFYRFIQAIALPQENPLLPEDEHGVLRQLASEMAKDFKEASGFWSSQTPEEELPKAFLLRMAEDGQALPIILEARRRDREDLVSPAEALILIDQAGHEVPSMAMRTVRDGERLPVEYLVFSTQLEAPIWIRESKFSSASMKPDSWTSGLQPDGMPIWGYDLIVQSPAHGLGLEERRTEDIAVFADYYLAAVPTCTGLVVRGKLYE